MEIKIIYLSKFAFKNISLSTLSGNNLFRLALTIWPALENTLSDGTDVAGIQEYFKATSHNAPNICLLFFQNNIGSSWMFKNSIFMYCLNNVAAVLEYVVWDRSVVTVASKYVNKFSCKETGWLLCSSCSAVVKVVWYTLCSSIFLSGAK